MGGWNRIAYKLGWTRMKRGKHVQFPKQVQTEGRLPRNRHNRPRWGRYQRFSPYGSGTYSLSYSA